MLASRWDGLWAAVALGWSCGCATSTVAYDGPEQPRNQVARIAGNSGAIVRVVDDTRIKENVAEVLPGEHWLIVGLRAHMSYFYVVVDVDVDFSSEHDQTICFTAFAGRRYEVRPAPTQSFLSGRWRAAVFDNAAQVFVEHPCSADRPPVVARVPSRRVPARSPFAVDAAKPDQPPASPVPQRTDSE
jgi:hypothetical protein